MAVRGSITYVGAPDAKAKELRRIIKEGLQQVATGWHADVLPRHFARGAKQRYGYKDRSPQYERRKQRKYHHTVELVYTGQLMREVSRMARVSGTSRRVALSMSAPQYLYKYKPTQPDKADELTRVTQDEAEGLAKSLDRIAQAEFNRINPKRTVTV